MQEYGRKIIEHFENPRNVGRLPTASGEGTAGNPSNGPFMVITIEVIEGAISDVRFKTYGCPVAVSCGSVITELAKGKSIEEAERITESDVAAALGGIRVGKEHCPALAVDTLRRAIEDYLTKARCQEERDARSR